MWFWLILACFSVLKDGVDQSVSDTAGDGETGVDPPEDLDTAEDTATQVPVTGIHFGGEQRCADPEARLTDGPFYEIDMGLAWNELPARGKEDARPSVVVADLTGDGRLDFLVLDRDQPHLWANMGDGVWENQSDGWLPALGMPGGDARWRANVAGAADLNGDGFLDVYIGSTLDADRILFGRAEAPMVLMDGPFFSGRKPRCLAFGDTDGDGDLDLFIGHDAETPGTEAARNELLINDGEGVFLPFDGEFRPEEVEGVTMHCAIIDFDRDGLQDIYVINHYPSYGYKNSMLFNDGVGGFGSTDGSGADILGHGMGLGLADINGDDLPDLLISDVDVIHLLESMGPRLWFDSALSRGLSPDGDRDQSSAWGGLLADVDNDGLLDAWVNFGPISRSLDSDREANEQPDALWIQQPDGMFEDNAVEMGVAGTGAGRSIVLADLNEDGFLDSVSVYRHSRPVVRMSRCSSKAWLTVRLRRSDFPYGAVGAVVKVWADGRTWSRWMAGNLGYASSGPFEMYFGLDEAAMVDRMEVTWPDGSVSTFKDFATRQIITIVDEDGS
jgi:hypothetical protein